MSLTVDPKKIEELAAEFKRLSSTIENGEISINNGIRNLIDDTNEKYTETYVRATTSEIGSLLNDIRKLASSITEQLNDKHTLLVKTADQYRQDEDTVKQLSQKSVGFSLGTSTNINKTPSFGLASGVAPLTADLSVSAVYSKEVEQLQKRLNELGYNLEVDGKFGGKTEAAVNDYKAKYGLGNTGKYKGVVGEQTWLFLFGKLSGELSIKSKEYSAQVRVAQIRLKELGYDVDVNGYFNEKTLKAVNEFKKANKLGNTGEWEGKIGPQTWETLFGAGVIANGGNSTSTSKPSNLNTDSNSTGLILSRKSIDKIIYYEVTDKKTYLQKYVHPELPGTSSGITIGIGYDLGYVSKAQFEKDWKGILSDKDYNLLLACVGRHLIEGNDKNNQEVRNLLKKVSGVTVSWEKADKVFLEKTLPKYIALARNTFPNFDKLPENAQGALVSLVYNRGGSLDRSSDRRKEMVAIADYMKNKTQFTQADLDYIANKIKEMKRLWPGKDEGGLRDRRDDEAAYLKNALKSANSNTEGNFKELKKNLNEVNEDVKKLQKRLNELGYQLEADGRFGDKTEVAVNDFKKKYGLGNNGKYEGVVGEQTWLYLFRQIDGNLSIANKEYSDEVHMAQVRLKELGYDVTPNGKFDEKMLAAVNKFKEKNNLSNSGNSKGIIGPQTWQTLFGAGAIGAKGAVSSTDSTKPNNNQSGGSQSTKGFTELPKEGPGFKRQGGNITAWGTPSTIDSFMSIAKNWSEKSDKLIYYNDLSQKNGGDHPDHKTHDTGRDIDIRPIRKDNKNEGGITWESASYDRDATRKLIEIILEDPNVESIYFNDPVLIDEFEPKVIEKPKHSNHLHINFKK